MKTEKSKNSIPLDCNFSVMRSLCLSLVSKTNNPFARAHNQCPQSLVVLVTILSLK